MGERSKGKSDGGAGGGNTGHTMFVFGQSYGEILMALDALRDLGGFDLHYVTITPNAWQRALSIEPKRKHGPRKESKGAFKSRLANTARTIFPQRTLTLETADAALLAVYGKEFHTWS
jgi:hypothetical protein